MQDNNPYPILNQNWKNACKIILGGEVGELEDFGEWLTESMEPAAIHPSSISGKKVIYGITNYRDSSKWLSYDEVNFNKKFEPLGINDIKDIDSVLEAVQERLYYAGNVVLGKSMFVEESSNITDSFYVLRSNFIAESKYIAYSSLAKYSENLFGTHLDALSKFIIRGSDIHEDQRCLEVLDTYLCSDAYYCFGLKDSSECMFSFNVNGKRHVIGNLQLPKDKYLGIKAKLLADLRLELKANKRLPGLLELMGTGEPDFAMHKVEFQEIARQTEPRGHGTDMIPMEKSFSEATKAVLGRSLGPLEGYREWLMRHVRRVDLIPSVISGRKTAAVDIMPFKKIPKSRVVCFPESIKAAEIMHLDESEVERLNLETAPEYLGKIALFATEVHLRENHNLIDATLTFRAQNCYCGGGFVETKNSAFCFWPRNSDHMFGCNTVFSSAFCINAYYSSNLSRCFAVDSSKNCSSSYFLHNCENVHDSMFCFNVKNRRNAIGNAELERSKYAEISKKLIAELADEIEKTHSLSFDIYNLLPAKA